MAKSPEPMTLELATLSREQMGPYLLLGVGKDGDKDTIEAQWAKRLKECLSKRVNLAREDVNWAKEMLNDKDKRLRADAASLNLDTADGVLGQLSTRYNSGAKGGRAWQPLDSEKPLSDYMPPAEVPDIEAVKAAVAAPEIPEDVPAVPFLLVRLAQAPLDPWDPELLR
jgi:hypothetical protein